MKGFNMLSYQILQEKTTKKKKCSTKSRLKMHVNKLQCKLLYSQQQIALSYPPIPNSSAKRTQHT